MFHCLVINVRCVCLSDSSFTLSHSFLFVKNFFQVLKQVFQNSFWSDAPLIEATCIFYHKVFCLSTIIFAFFKTFWIVYSLETISCDSSIRIPLSSSPVNTLFYFSLKYSGSPHGRRVCPIKSEDCGRLLVGYMRDAGDWYRTTNVANSAGFLIRCMRRFDAIREELAPDGAQTFPSVASASLHLINGICADICSLLLFISSSRLTHQCFMSPATAFCY